MSAADLAGADSAPATAPRADPATTPATPPAGGSEASGSVGELLWQAAERDPDGTALRFGEASTSWRELAERAARIATGLLAAGLSPGDRVALLLGNTPDFAAAYFAVLRAGLVAVPMNTSLTGAERQHVVDDSGAAAVLVGADLAADAEVAQLAARLRLVVVARSPANASAAEPPGTRTVDEIAEGGSSSLPPAPSGEDLAVLVYTSGTSGRPRGAMLTHRALLANLDQLSRIDPPVIQADDTALLVLPLFHIYGLNAGLGLAVRAGATSVLLERFEPVESLELIARHDVTVVVGAPPMYVAWSMLPDAESAFTSVRLAISGSAPLPAPVLTRMIETTGHHVFEGYGLTETAPVLTTTLMSEAAKPGSIGRPIPGVELRLADAGDLVEASDADLPGEVGVIEVRGANLFTGYWPDGRGGPGADGWWSTGDVAFLDDDGDLHLIDRARELILVSGFNVYPREVEQVLEAQPDVLEAAVIGIPHPYTGQSVKALVVPAPGATLTAADVIDWASRSLARFKCPTSVQFVDALPHTATGKVSKARLRELAGDAG